MADPIKVVIEDDTETVRVDPISGNIEVDQPDGGVVVQFDAYRRQQQQTASFSENLVDKIDQTKLGQIAEELFAGIEADDRSRQDYLAIRSRGFDLLGLKLEQPRSNVGEASAAAEGMSSVTNPLLLDTLLKGWGGAQGEMLPAAGPVKIRDDGRSTVQTDDLAEALERDFNHYLTKVATEYYPDTSHMLLWGTYFGGSGFKKVYRCPMRRRPVSESVDAKNLIVSDTTKDLRSCARITHEILMRPSVMKRMMFLGAYRDIALGQPTPSPNQVDEKIAGIQGTGRSSRPEDQPFTIWEAQCELDLDEYAPRKFRGEGIPLPFLVTMDKDSRQILAIRRDWNKQDEDCNRRRMYVKYPYVPGPGFYGTGLLNILGNCSAAMTAAWREALDAGMYANFPAFIFAKLAGRQNTSDFRLAPGTGTGIETNGMPIGQAIMGLPYKDVTPGLMALMDKITQQAKSVGGSADIPSAEGIQNVPVGTMLAQIEMASKVISAAHKGMHTAQADEFDLFLDLFRENPEDFWRGNKNCTTQWDAQKFVQAIDNCQLVPVSDPNVPSHLHRIAKAIALAQLIVNPVFTPIMSAKETLQRILRAMREDEQGLVIDPPPQAGGEPPLGEQAKMVAAQARAAEVPIKAAQVQQKAKTDQDKKDIETIELAQRMVSAKSEEAQSRAKAQRETVQDAMSISREAMATKREERKDAREAVQSARDFALQAGVHDLNTAKTAHDMRVDDHGMKMSVAEFMKPEPKPAPKPKPKK